MLFEYYDILRQCLWEMLIDTHNCSIYLFFCWILLCHIVLCGEIMDTVLLVVNLIVLVLLSSIYIYIFIRTVVQFWFGRTYYLVHRYSSSSRRASLSSNVSTSFASNSRTTVPVAVKSSDLGWNISLIQIMCLTYIRLFIF